MLQMPTSAPFSARQLTTEGIILYAAPCIAVLDDGGNLKAFQRSDGPGAALRPQIAIGKAFGSVGMGVPSRVLETRAKDRPHFFNSLFAVSEGKRPTFEAAPDDDGSALLEEIRRDRTLRGD